MTDETTIEAIPATEAVDVEPAHATEQQEPMLNAKPAAWWREGVRTAVFLKPDWTALPVTPGMVALLLLVPVLVGLLFERLYIDGPALFYWPGLLSGWFNTLVLLFACWMVVGRDPVPTPRSSPSAVALFAMMQAQMLPILVLSGAVFVAMVRGGTSSDAPRLWWTIWFGFLGWYALVQLVLLWRGANAGIRQRVAAMALVAGAFVLNHWIQPPHRWYPKTPPAGTASEAMPEPLKLTQELLELQPPLLQSKLQALARGRPGAVDVYAITFAPYAEEDVFQRESQMVASVMEERFGASGKTIQLVNHRDTARQWPWATPLNLQRSIQAVARVMDREEDVLFIHLASHGARNGHLAAEFSPLDVESVTPAMLRKWLDDAGIRHRVISISACFSGSWIEPLSEPGTLVMTAADADHTSYGCGRGSPLTFFGRAMYDEQLRHTWSFEKAHAAARVIIEQRERDAGKTDGYSNPQIRMGEAIRERLSRLEAELAKRVK